MEMIREQGMIHWSQAMQIIPMYQVADKNLTFTIDSRNSCWIDAAFLESINKIGWSGTPVSSIL